MDEKVLSIILGHNKALTYEEIASFCSDKELPLLTNSL